MAFSLLWLVVGDLWAVQPQRVVMDSVEEFSQGELESVILEEPGVLMPGIKSELLADLETALIWDAARLPQSGGWVVGTGPKGAVIQINQKGVKKTLTQFTESDVYAVAVSPDGYLYAASSPDGKIFRRNKSGEFEVWFEHGEKFVWDMVFDKKGRLYLATGQEGKLFRVTGKNQGEVIFDAEEPHLRVMAWNAKGDLKVGTAGSAVLYRVPVASQGSPVVVLDAQRVDVSALAVDDSGVVYVAAIGKSSAPAGTGAPCPRRSRT